MRWLAPALLIPYSTVCLAQADIDVGGSEADDYGTYDRPYPDQGGYGQDSSYGQTNGGYGQDGGYRQDSGYGQNNGGYGQDGSYRQDSGYGQNNGGYGQDGGYQQDGSYGQNNGGYRQDGGYGNASDRDPGMGDGLPIVYAGDGMRVSIDQVDDTGTRARGTVTLGRQAPMPFEVQMQMGQNGEMSVGQIRTSSGPKPFRAWDQSEDVTVAEFDGRRYRLVYQEASQGGAYDRPNAQRDPRPPQREPNPPGDYGHDRRNNTPPRRDAPQPPPSAHSASPKTVELVLHKLGHTHTLLVPKGWKVDGGAWQPPVHAYNWMPSRDITVTGPDGSSVRFKPHLSAIDQRMSAGPRHQSGSLNAQAGLVNMPMPASGTQWAQWVERESIRATYHNASDIRVRDGRIVPALTENLRRLYAPMTQFMASFNAADASMRAEQQAWSVDSVYSADGRRWQQVDAFNHFALIGQVASAFGGFDYYIGWDLRDAVSLRAPEGTLDAQMPLLLAIVNSLRQTPKYTQQIVQMQTKIAKGNHEVAMKTIETYRQISQSSYNANQAVNASIAGAYQARTDSQDRGQRDFVNYIRGQQDYADPSVNANVTLPASYDRVFSNGKGEYVLTNDVSFEPGADWSSIQRTRQ